MWLFANGRHRRGRWKKDTEIRYNFLYFLSGKEIKKTKNDLLAMKQILYDMGPLILVRWPL